MDDEEEVKKEEDEIKIEINEEAEDAPIVTKKLVSSTRSVTWIYA